MSGNEVVVGGSGGSGTSAATQFTYPALGHVACSFYRRVVSRRARQKNSNAKSRGAETKSTSRVPVPPLLARAAAAPFTPWEKSKGCAALSTAGLSVDDHRSERRETKAKIPILPSLHRWVAKLRKLKIKTTRGRIQVVNGKKKTGGPPRQRAMTRPSAKPNRGALTQTGGSGPLRASATSGHVLSGFDAGEKNS